MISVTEYELREMNMTSIMPAWNVSGQIYKSVLALQSSCNIKPRGLELRRLATNGAVASDERKTANQTT